MTRSAAISVIIVICLILTGGCIQQSTISPAPTIIPQSSPVQTTIQTVIPPTAVPATLTFPIPTPTLLDKTIKDSTLNFALDVPRDWNGTTIRSNNPEGYEGLGYITTFTSYPGIPVSNENEVFDIITYAITRGQDQAFRTYYRDNWIPTPQESTVTVHGLTLDRFQTSADNRTAVAYVVRKASANEKGFASVIYFRVNEGKSTYDLNTFERIVQSFRYGTSKDMERLSAEETSKDL
jgi:hypothetical protein